MQCNATLSERKEKLEKPRVGLSQATGSRWETTPVASGLADDGMRVDFVVTGPS